MERGSVIAAGFGFRAGASLESLSDALRRCAGAGRVDLLATARDKADAPVFAALAAALDLPARGIDPEDLAAQRLLTASAAARAARGVGSLAEAAALAAAPPGARLRGPRVISADRMASCALAEGETT